MTAPSPRTGSRRPLLAGLGVLALVIGLTWMGQGAGLIPGSFMTGDPTWLAIGAVAAVLGVLLVVGGLRRRPGGRPVDPL